MKQLLWQPSQDRIESANLTHFQQLLAERWGLMFNSYAELHEWSITELGQFWRAIWLFGRVIAQQEPNMIMQAKENWQATHWFEGARLNFAENLLRYNGEHIALVTVRENGHKTRLTYRELYAQVARLCVTWQSLGLEAGDRVAAVLPNTHETVVAMLATTALGAIWTSCSPDFGAAAVVDRFGQIEPKILLVADGYEFKGQQHDLHDLTLTLQQELPSLTATVIVPYLGLNSKDDEGYPFLNWPDCLATSSSLIPFVKTSFDHPLYIVYSSGTTGKPKCLVHGVGGTLLQHLKELLLHSDLKRQDTLFFYTTCGWMMWHWMVSGLAVGATLVLYDGAPLYPQTTRLFDLIEAEGVTHFGTSAKYLTALQKAHVIPKNSHDLQTLLTILTTGSPLLPESFDYVYEAIKTDLCLSSISGGTDILSCFALGNPQLPVYRGELQCRGLGMDVAFYDETGQAHVGQKGELVCQQAFPSMPLYFWQDEQGEQYRQSYFARYPNVWAHGDFGELTPNGGVILYGRSDAVLNPAGVRIGTAEIYRQVEVFDEVMECVAVAQDWQADQRIILFVVLRDGASWSLELEQSLKENIRVGTSPRHVPAKVIAVQDIPRTINGKMSELAVRAVIHGQEVKNREALANPDSLRYFANLPELQTD